METFYAPSLNDELATLSEGNQVELEKVQELGMAVEEQGPSPKALSGVVVWSAKR